MFSRIASRLTYANVIATLALFVALGGGAYAAATLPKNSVGPAQLQNGAVTPPKLAKSTRTSLKGKTGTAGQQGTQGPAGPAGAQGPQGATGAQGAPGGGGAAGATGAQGVQGASGARGATGVQGATGPAGDPATADGSAVELGNLHGPGAGSCLVGAPSGVSTSGPVCSAVGADPLSSPTPVDTVARDLTVTIPSALAADSITGLVSVPGIFFLTCTIPAGQKSCTIAGPSDTIPAGTPIFFIEEDPTVTSVHFSYRLGTPGTSPAPTAPAIPHPSFYRRG